MQQGSLGLLQLSTCLGESILVEIDLKNKIYKMKLANGIKWHIMFNVLFAFNVKCQILCVL